MTTQALQDSELFKTGYLVNGEWRQADETFDVLNPATGDVIAKVAKAGKKEARRPSPRQAMRFQPGVKKPLKSAQPCCTAGSN